MDAGSSDVHGEGLETAARVTDRGDELARDLRALQHVVARLRVEDLSAEDCAALRALLKVLLELAARPDAPSP